MTNYRKTFVFIVLMAFMLSGVAVAATLEYELIEDSYDDTTQIRTMTEQAPLSNGEGWLIRTTVYTPHHISMVVTLIPTKKTEEGLFTPAALTAFDSVPDPISELSSMTLEYEVIEDSFDDTTHIRTMTEQAEVSGLGWLMRTTRYTPHHITMDVTFIPVKKNEIADGLYDPVG